MNGNIGFGPAGTFLQNLHDLRVGHAPHGLAVDLYEDVTLLEVFAPGKKMVLIFLQFRAIFVSTYLGLSKIFLTFCPNCESAIVNPNPIPPLVMGMVITLSESGTPGPEPPDPRRSALLGLKFSLEN